MKARGFKTKMRGFKIFSGALTLPLAKKCQGI